MKKCYLLILINFIAICLFSEITQARSDKPLTIDKAFSLTARTGPDHSLLLNFKIAPGYYLYKNKFAVKISEPKNAQQGLILFPKAFIKKDPIFTEQPVYQHDIKFSIPILNLDKEQTAQVTLTFQGCSDKGFCYPPTTRIISTDFLKQTTQIEKPTLQPHPSKNKALLLITQQSLFFIIAGFIAFGLLLSFTPCVLPMLPILSGIIMGYRKQMTTLKAFSLSVIYVLSMAFTYALLGTITGFAGSNVQVLFQKTGVIVLFSLIFILLALSLLGFYSLKLPNRLENQLSRLSGKQKGGTFFGVAMMGVLSTLIVSPCVTAPLIGVLSYIGSTGDALLGGVALFSMGVGMGIPLVIFGTLGGKLIPKSGPWMTVLEKIFGFVLLGVAVWLLDKVLPSSITMMLWGMLLIIFSLYLGAFTPRKKINRGERLKQGLALAIMIYGALLMIGGSMGHDNLLKPLKKTSHEPFFIPITNIHMLKETLKSSEKPIAMLDFYADWCHYCKVMAKTIFRDPAVKAATRNLQRLQVDVTLNTEEDKQLLQQFGIIAPPVILFLDKQGNEILRIEGDITKKAFLKHINHLSTQ